MNTKTLFKLGTMLAILLVLVVGNAFAAKYYVNVVTGLDGYNGLSALVGGPGVGPKQTISNAITAASPGDTIIVDYGFGNLYNENVTVTKQLVFGTSANNWTTGSTTPVVLSWTVNNAVAAPGNTVTFTGPYLFQNGLTLTQGAVIGAGNLTVAVAVSRNSLSNTVSGTVDAQLNYSGTVNFTYTTGGFNVTTGFELPAAANTTNFGALTTTGGGTLTLNEAKTMKGVLTTSGAFVLGGNTLNFTAGSTVTAHVIAGNVTGGTLNFTLGAASSITGAFTIPVVVTTVASGTTVRLLTLTGVTTTGDLTSNTATSITAAAATTVGNVVKNGTGAVTLTAAVATSSLTNSGSGAIVLNAAGLTTVTGNVLQSGSGNILFNSTTSNHVTGNVTNNPTLTVPNNAVTAAAANFGVIRFVGDFPLTIDGNVVVQSNLSGTLATTAITTATNIGEISIGAAASLTTISGSVTINATHALAFANAGFAATVSNCAGITLANAGGAVVITGGIINTTIWPSVTSPGAGITMANDGDFAATALAAGTFTVGAISNTSSASNIAALAGHGNILIGVAGTTGAFIGTSVVTSGTDGGVISVAGNAATFTTSGSVTNSRKPTGAFTHLVIGTAATAGNSISIGGDLVSNANSSETTSFVGYNGAGSEPFGVTGTVNVSAGTILVGGAQTSGSFSFGNVILTGGTIQLNAANSAKTMNVLITGNATFTAGTLSMGTSAARTLQLGGLSHSFSAAAARTDFVSPTGMANVTLLIQPSTVLATQTITGNATTTAWSGPVNVNNISGLQPSVVFNGGNFRVLNNVTFTAGQVAINGVTFFIGGQLAPLVGGGNLTNTAGYITGSVGNIAGFVSMNGNAAQTVGGALTFGNFECDNAAGVTVLGGTGAFTGTFNLTNGAVAGGALVNFNNAVNPPTIVVNAGTLAGIPTFTSVVNVYYIGVDKTTGNELPAAATKLNNLTVATTNGGITTGRGVVQIFNAPTTVNGILNIFPGQALLLTGTTTLTLKGATAQVDGDLANFAAANKLILDAATGTAISGAGLLPDIQVNAGSVGNSINGTIGLATGLLGADLVRSPLVDDINPGSTGGIIFVGGASASSLMATFGTANTTTNAHLQSVTTAANGTFTLGSALVMHPSGNLTNGASGIVDVGAFTLTLQGTTPSFDGTSTTTGTTGKVLFNMPAATALTVPSSPATIAANVDFATTPAGGGWTATLTTNNLTLAGNVELKNTSIVDVAALTLTATGSSVIMNAGTAFAASGGGILKLNAAAPPMTFAYTGATTIANLTIVNDVNLANGPGGAATALTVTGTLLHTAGVLNFGAINLTAGGVYTNTAGTYAATTGYLIYSGVGATFNQGAAGFSIPNLRIASGAAANATGAGIVTVTNALDVANTGTFTHTVGGNPTLTVSDGATVNWTSGRFDVMPTYAGHINLVAKAYATGSTMHASVWPSSPGLVSNFTVNGTLTTDAVYLPGDRGVGTGLFLTKGVLDLTAGATAASVLTMADNSMVTRLFGGRVVVGAPGGALAYGLNMTVIYQSDGALVPAGVPQFVTGAELPASVANLTFSRKANVINSFTSINSDVTVTGLLTIGNNVMDNLAVGVSVAGNAQIINESGTFANATNPTINLTSLAFTGTGNQMFTVLATGAGVNNLTINQTGTGSTVTVVGGGLAVGGTMTFVNGILVTGTFPIALAGPVNRAGVTGTNISHIFGTVTRTIAVLGRYEYPVGSMTQYRPASITFPTIVPAAIGLTVQHVDVDPLGRLGLPATDSPSGIRIGGYPPYYWLVMSTTSLGQSIPYDLEYVGTSPFGRPFNRADDLRIIHRFDGNDLLNPWSIQGLGTSYSNFLAVRSNGDTVVTVRVRGQLGGIVPEASRYTIGIPTRPPVWTVAPATLTVDEGAALSAQFTADAQDVGETMAYSLTTAPAGMAISATGLLTWTPGYDQAGVKNVVISATDGEFTITQNVAVTVVNVNRAPVFAPKTVSLTKTDKDTVKVTLAATDGDGDALTYSVLSIDPAATNAPAVAGNQLTWKPTFAEAGHTYTLMVLVSDGVAAGQGPLPGTDTMTVTVVVNRSRALGDADGNGLVQAADAAAILSYVAGLTTVTDPAALWAMDASKNGTITAFDGSLVLQAAAGLIPPLTGTISDAGLSKGAALQATGNLEMASPEATTNPEVVMVGLKLSNPANVYSVALTTRGDFSLVSIDAVNATLPEGWDMKWNVVGNELRIAAAGTTPLATGDVAAIMVHLKSKESRVSFSTDAMLNENFQSLGAVEVAAVPTVYALDQNYPNPFNPSTTIRYQIPTDASVTLDVFNVKGQKIRTLVSKEQKAGYYSVVWDGRNEAGQTVSTGLYLYRVQAGSFVATQKMLMLK